MSLLKLFCNVDDFWKAFQPHWRPLALSGPGVALMLVGGGRGRGHAPLPTSLLRRRGHPSHVLKD